MDPPAKVVGDTFAKLYYYHLQNFPELLYQYYKDNSMISRPGPDGTMRASTLPDIIEDLNMLASGGFDSAEVTCVTSQDSLSGGIVVAVDGYFIFNERREREFTQSFFLAPQEKGYFVRNDMFMLVERSEAEASITPANNAICVKNLPPYATIDLVENALKQFGDIRRGGCELRHKEGFSYGFVEFKEAKAAQKAIEASPIMIDESITYVEKKRPDYRSYWETPSSGPGNIYGSVEMRGTQALESMEEVRGTKAPGNNNDESQRVSEPNDETGNGNNQESQAVPEDACIFVKNLPPNVTIALVENAFKQFGEIRSGGIKFHKTKKCCFVEFEEADAAKRAIMESPIMIDWRTCYVEKKLPDYKTVTECSGIHLKNLPLTAATSTLIEDAFKKFGPIKSGGIKIKKTTNLEHSYGFVLFEEADAAKRAIKASPVKIDGNYVHVEWQKAKAKQSRLQAEAEGTQVDHSWDTEEILEDQRKFLEEAGGTQVDHSWDTEQILEDQRKFLEDLRKRQPEREEETQETQNRAVTECSGIHIKNLPLTATSSLIEDAFKKFGPIKRGGVTIKTPNLEHSYGFVEFEEADAAKRAIKASPVKIDGKYVHVEWQKQKAKQSRLQAEAGGTQVDHSWDTEEILEDQRKFLEETEQILEEQRKVLEDLRKRQPEREEEKEETEETQN